MPNEPDSPDPEAKPDHDPLWKLAHPFRAAAARAFDTMTPSKPSTPEQDRVGDRYERLEKIGQGGMGEIFKVYDRELERVFALKFTEPRFATRLKEEARAISRLDHPCIARLYEFLVFDKTPALKMEFVPGENLAFRIARQGPLDDLAAASLVEKLSLAVQHAHEMNVLHRDLKPENVLLIENTWEPKIIDFGLALHLFRDQRLTEPGVIMGTPGYMPPEQARGDRDAGPALDIFGLGGILYFCLTGHPPDADMSSPMRSLPNRCDFKLREICCKCMAASPSDRYRNAGELALALRSVQRPRGLSNRSRLSVLGMGLALLMALIFLAWSNPFRKDRTSAQVVAETLERTRDRYQTMLSDLEQVPEQKRSQIRYVLIAPGTDPRAAQLLRRTLNGWQLGPQPIALELTSDPSLYRLDLALISARPSDFWGELVSKYPYALRFQEQENAELRSADQMLLRQTGTVVSLIHADWLVRQLVRRGEQLPGVDATIEFPSEWHDFAQEWDGSTIDRREMSLNLGFNLNELESLLRESADVRSIWEQIPRDSSGRTSRRDWESTVKGPSYYQSLERELLGATPIDL